MGVPAGIFLEFDSINFIDFVKRFDQEFAKKHTHLRIYLRKTMEKKVSGKNLEIKILVKKSQFSSPCTKCHWK